MAVKYKKRHQRPQHARSVWSTAYVNSLPDSSFAAIDENGDRHLPYKDKDGNIDIPHLRNALARLDQTDISPQLKAKARKKLEAAARKVGVGDYGSATDTDQGERMTMPIPPVSEDLSDVIERARDPLDLVPIARDTFLDVARAAGLTASD